jgi:DNA-binding CsgD family transcriptional regulator
MDERIRDLEDRVMSFSPNALNEEDAIREVERWKRTETELTVLRSARILFIDSWKSEIVKHIRNGVYVHEELAKLMGISPETVSKIYNGWDLDRIKYSLDKKLKLVDIALIKRLINDGLNDEDIAEKFSISPVMVEGIRLNHRGIGVKPAC